MPKYKESMVQGEVWRRAFQIIGSNDYNKQPTIFFNEEDVVLLSDNSILKNHVGSIGEVFTFENANTSFQLRNPNTEEYVEAYATYQDVFVLLHSLYFHLAKERDKGPNPFASWIWNDSTGSWEAPIPKPEDGQEYTWNENLLEWTIVGG